MDRRSFIGGSDARIIMGNDVAALVQLWREKRGEAEPEDLSGNLIVQLGAATEELNRTWYERNTGRSVGDVQRRIRHSGVPWMVATLDGIVEGTGAVFEAKFMLPWSFSEESAAGNQHNMWVTHLRSAVLSIITGGGKWVEMTIPMDPLYLSVLVSAEKKFWRCVQSGEPPLREKLLLEIGSISSPDVAAAWAREALAAKNSLTATDATLVEDGFERRLSELSPSEIISNDRHSEIQVAAAHEGAFAEPTDPGQMMGIDKSALVVAAPRRYRNREHLRSVAKQPCLICGRRPSDPHHLRYLQPRALGRKASDEFAVPLCRVHHRAVHRARDERAWWQAAGIDPIRKLWKETRIDEGRIEPEGTPNAAERGSQPGGDVVERQGQA
jgi:YqaJ-like viral recombinase domain